MRKLKKSLIIFLVACLFIVTGCTKDNKDKNAGFDKTYNIIFALATIPPVLASLECISSGYETYAIIERGKTYSGIEQLEHFHNAGFDPASNLSNGFTDAEFNSMVNKVKELKSEDTFFYFYAQDGKALTAAAVAANAGLSTEQFHIYILEDGTGAYYALKDTYFVGKTVNDTVDEPYDTFVNGVASAKAEFETIMSKTNNTVSDAPMGYNIAKAFCLATLDNFTYYLQDKALVEDIVKNTLDKESKLANCFGMEGYDVDKDYSLNLKYQKISEGVKKLTEEQRKDYLTLMYGQYFEDTDAALTRTKRADKDAPEQKLVFIGSRHGGYPQFASNPDYGIGGLDSNAKIPTTYAELDSKYKNELLFATEDDYKNFIAVLNNSDNYTVDATEEAKQKAQVATFNYYIDYIYTLKLTYALYGEDYDIIMKGHPREVIGGHAEWNGQYYVTLSNGTNYVFDKVFDMALLDFHTNDSTGKYIGTVPYGTSAENLAYLGADLSIAGLPSSTYAGYDLDIDVLFVTTETNQDILGSGEDVIASQVNARYEAGNLVYTDKDGNTQNAVFLNTGNMLKYSSNVFKELGNTALATQYKNLFEAWLKDIHGDAADIDAQGFKK